MSEFTRPAPVRARHVHGPREPVNGWFHFVGALLASAGLVVLTVQAARRDSLRYVIGAVTFGTSAVMMFSASALYHLRNRSRFAPLYRRLDHAMIYLFIAGTYTPVCLVALWPRLTGRILLTTVWILASAGLLLDLLGRRIPRGPATLLYLALGWALLPAMPTLVAYPGLVGWLVVGGIFYTLGALIYWRRWPRGRPGVLGFHEIWHLCVLAASASHFWAIRTYLLTL